MAEPDWNPDTAGRSLAEILREAGIESANRAPAGAPGTTPRRPASASGRAEAAARRTPGCRTAQERPVADERHRAAPPSGGRPPRAGRRPDPRHARPPPSRAVPAAIPACGPTASPASPRAVGTMPSTPRPPAAPAAERARGRPSGPPSVRPAGRVGPPVDRADPRRPARPDRRRPRRRSTRPRRRAPSPGCASPASWSSPWPRGSASTSRPPCCGRSSRTSPSCWHRSRSPGWSRRRRLAAAAGPGAGGPAAARDPRVRRDAARRSRPRRRGCSPAAPSRRSPSLGSSSSSSVRGRTCSTIAAPNASRSSGLRLVIRLPSTTTSSSTQSAPALRRSVCSDGHDVIRRPFTDPGLDEHPGRVADGRDRLAGVEERRHERDRVGVGADEVAVDDAAGQDQRRVGVGVGRADDGVDLLRVALVEVVAGGDRAARRARPAPARRRPPRAPATAGRARPARRRPWRARPPSSRPVLLPCGRGYPGPDRAHTGALRFPTCPFAAAPPGPGDALASRPARSPCASASLVARCARADPLGRRLAAARRAEAWSPPDWPRTAS